MSTTHRTVSWGWVGLCATAGALSLIGGSVLSRHPLLRDLPIGQSDLTVAALSPLLGNTLVVVWAFLLARHVAGTCPDDGQGGTWAQTVVPPATLLGGFLLAAPSVRRTIGSAAGSQAHASVLLLFTGLLIASGLWFTRAWLSRIDSSRTSAGNTCPKETVACFVIPPHSGQAGGRLLATNRSTMTPASNRAWHSRQPTNRAVPCNSRTLWHPAI